MIHIENTKVLAINSLPANGNAGLKMVMSVLGTNAIPVPSLVLSGIGNMKGYQRFDLDFETLLESSIKLAIQEEYRLVVYSGYLANEYQANIIAKVLTKYNQYINYFIVDPVCGDNGKAYVSEKQIDSLHQLLALADLALPNLTEAALLTGFRENILEQSGDHYIAAFKQKYPLLEIIVTGIVEKTGITNNWIKADDTRKFSNQYHPQHFSGTGDAFASLLIYLLIFERLEKSLAIEKAGKIMELLIWNALEMKHSTLNINASLLKAFF